MPPNALPAVRARLAKAVKHAQPGLLEQQKTILISILPEKMSDHMSEKTDEFDEYDDFEQEMWAHLKRITQNKKKMVQ